MAHSIVLNYGQLGTSEGFNKHLNQIIPDGFMTDVTLTKVTNTEVSISTFVAWITDSTKDLSVRIEGTTSEASIAIDSTKPYIVISLTWVNNSSNDFTITSNALGSILTNDLVVGMGNFTGPTLNSFDYTDQTINPLKNFYQFNYIDAKTTIVDADLLLINDSADSFEPKQVTFENLQRSSRLDFEAISGTDTLDFNNDVVTVNGTFTLTLPAGSGNVGKTFYIKNIGTGTVTIATTGDTIDGAGTYTLSVQYEWVIVTFGTEWHVIG